MFRYDFAEEATSGAQLEPFHYTFGADRGMLELVSIPFLRSTVIFVSLSAR